MRLATATALLLGLFAGAAGGWLVGTRAATDSADAAGGLRDVASRLDRVEHKIDALSRSIDRIGARTIAASAEPQASSDVPEGPGRPAAASDVVGERGADWNRLSNADLELEADERHGNGTDNAGALRRYETLILRGGTPAQIRRWSVRRGDCLVRLGRPDAADDAYRAAVDASLEDTHERYICALALAKHVQTTDEARALEWIDVALQSKSAQTDREPHQVAADIARAATRPDRERTELAWLVEHFASLEPQFGWNSRLRELGGR